MRVRTVWMVIAAVNVLWAAAFFGYTHRSTAPVVRGGEIVHSDARSIASVTNTNAGPRVAKATNAPVPAKVAATNTAAPQTVAATPTPPAVPAGREFGWQDVTNDVYKDYILRLRAAGCPEKQVRSIVVADVNELFDKRRLEHSIRIDTPWWKAENFFGIVQVQNIQNLAGANFDEDRRQLLDKILGSNWDSTLKLTPLNAGTVPLAGPVLGALPSETWNTVQEVCAKSMERHQNFIMSRIDAGSAYTPESPEMAKLRDYTRTELTKILTPEQLEEFLLRYSHNATKLRQEMRGLDITPEEFRKIFRVIDPLEHQMQLDYGGPEALSEKQREQFQAQRDRAIRESISPERYQMYLITKDPLYKQAQLTAMQYGMNAKAVQPIYEIQKSMEARRLQISQNNALTPEQKAQELQSIVIQQQQSLQKLQGDANYR